MSSHRRGDRSPGNNHQRIAAKIATARVDDSEELVKGIAQAMKELKAEILAEIAANEPYHMTDERAAEIAGLIAGDLKQEIMAEVDAKLAALKP